ncbi:yeats family-domain-containing protein [Gilbertella persicaria]|uniref:yeats family-domain-containing protein n=1 Tax=Gilbertella persicaria TaxID=101096 RepID=UPI00221E9E23|nr:yeats family-domain-containing protein [Gilbertella persicaria]KAI8087637.1 yeats family-domain-containing protein [Gilbertella persicaria]
MKRHIRIFCNNKIIRNMAEDGLIMRSWKVYLKSMDSYYALSDYIDHVEYLLHPSFKTPHIVCTQEPYIIEQEGWGEFDLTIRLHFKDPSLSSQTIVFDLHFRKPKYVVQKTLDIPVLEESIRSRRSSSATSISTMVKTPTNCYEDHFLSLSVLYQDLQKQQQEQVNCRSPHMLYNQVFWNNLSHLGHLLESLNDDDLRKFYQLLSEWEDISHLGIIETEGKYIDVHINIQN